MGIPGVTSIKHGFQNIMGAVDYGIDLSRGTPRDASKMLNVGSVGGLATMGGLAGIGVAGGAAFGAMTDVDPVAGGLIGGAVGAAALPSIGFAAGMATRGADYMIRGGGALNALDGIYGAGKSAGIGMTQGAAAMLNTPMSPLSRYGGVAGRIMDNFATYTPSYMDYNKATGKLSRKGGLKLTGLGKGIIGAGAAVQGIRGGYEALERSRMGQMMPEVRTARPSVMQQGGQQMGHSMNHAGATGDLVFAMNANRQG